MGRQIPVEVTQGLPDPSEQGGPPGYAPDDKPVEERGGVPYEVWEHNQRNAQENNVLVAKKGKAKPADPESQPDVPDDYTAQEIAKSQA